MKVGDLVKWIYSSKEDLGIAIEPWATPCGDKYMIVYWYSTQNSSPVPIGHKYLEVLNESG